MTRRIRRQIELTNGEGLPFGEWQRRIAEMYRMLRG